MIFSFRVSGVREKFWFYFCGNNIIVSKYTEPLKTDVTFSFEYIFQPYNETQMHREEINILFSCSHNGYEINQYDCTLESLG